jgi:two-component system, OmpR family, sensor histidine kinase CreC
MKIRTAIFGVYVAASALGYAVVVAFVLHDVRLRYVESMRRTLGDTAAFLAVFVSQDTSGNDGWARKLAMLPPNADLLRVFACDRTGHVIFDSAHGRDVGQLYTWPLTGGGPAASENYTTSNVAEVQGELRVAAPVRRAGELVGWVGVGRPFASITEGVSKARWSLITVLCSIAAVMVLAGWWIATRLTQSIERLTDYAVAVREGRAVSPPQSRAKEVAALAQAFEEMRVALEGKAYVEHYTQALAHEFKAPLSSIRGAAELLAENPPEADRVRFIGNLRAESDRLQLLVERLLELAALESRRSGLALSEVNLGELLREIQNAASSAAIARGIELVVETQAGPPVRGERFLLLEAVRNLVQNALEFTPRGGRVSVTLQASAGHATVTVDDTGPGVPDYAIEKIFDRFYSLPRPDTGRKSSGLGLSIVREIARLHGGEVTLVNRAGGGARAMLSLPLG